MIQYSEYVRVEVRCCARVRVHCDILIYIWCEWCDMLLCCYFISLRKLLYTSKQNWQIQIIIIITIAITPHTIQLWPSIAGYSLLVILLFFTRSQHFIYQWSRNKILGIRYIDSFWLSLPFCFNSMRFQFSIEWEKIHLVHLLPEEKKNNSFFSYKFIWNRRMAYLRIWFWINSWRFNRFYRNFTR